MKNDDLSPLARRIQKRLDVLRLQPTVASRMAGLSGSGIRNIMEGKSDSPRYSTMEALAKVLQTSAEWLSTGRGEEFVEEDTRARRTDSNVGEDDFGVVDLGDGRGTASKKLTPKFVPELAIRAGASFSGGQAIEVPVADAHGNTYVGTLARAEWRIPDYYLSAAGLHASRTHILEVDGPSMLPDLKPEDRVIVDTTDTNPGVDGIFAIWDDSTHSVIIKNVQVVRGSDPLQITCISSNPTYAPFTLTLDGATRILGRVKRRITSV